MPFSAFRNPLHPLWLVGFFLALGLTAYGLSLPEIGTIGIAVVFFTALVALHPLNGVSFLLLVIPFFLGNPFKPYQFVLEIFVYGTLLSMAIRRPWSFPCRPFPWKIPVLLFLLSAAISLPLNTREIYYTVWALPFRDLFFQWLLGNPGAPIHGLRVLTNLFSAAALCWATYRALGETAEIFIVRNVQALVLMAALIAGIGFLFLFQWLPRGHTYASLSLVGMHENTINAFAFNRQFLAQYLLLLLPLAFFLGRHSLMKGDVLGLLLALFSVVLSILALTASISRSVYLILALQIAALLIGGAWLSRVRKKWLFIFALSPLAVVALLLALDWAFFNHLFIRRLQSLGQIVDRRPALWSTAWAMFSFSPWLGVGLGKYYVFFPDFFPGPPDAWRQFNVNRGNAHSIPIQLLAEQGIFGVLAYLFLAASLLVLISRGLTRESRPEMKGLRLALIIAVVTWLVLGLFHHIADDLRSLELFFWIVAAFLLALAPNAPLPFRLGWKTLVFLLCLLAVALGFHWQRIRAYPIGEHFQVGFYHWERGPDGNPLRWMAGRAAALLERKSGTLLIECRAPLPGVERNPQQVTARIDGHAVRFALGDSRWYRLPIPIPETRSRRFLLLLETAHTFNPARDAGSRDRRDLGMQLREFRWEGF